MLLTVTHQKDHTQEVDVIEIQHTGQQAAAMADQAAAADAAGAAGAQAA